MPLELVIRYQVLPSSSNEAFSIGQEKLSSISREHDTNALKEYEGNAFGSNNYPRKKGQNVLIFIWDACKDLTLIVLMVAAVASLALGIKSEVRPGVFLSYKGIKEGWYDGGSIVFAVILVISVTAVTNYKRSFQFQNLNERKRNIHFPVIRDGRRVEISIYDVVVGDVIPLNIGNQVPANGILITGHSLAIDESSMTGESKIVTIVVVAVPEGLPLAVTLTQKERRSSITNGNTFSAVDMDEEKMTVLRNVIEDMAADSLPCVAIAYRLLDETENIPTCEEELARWSLPEDDLVLLAIVGLKIQVVKWGQSLYANIQKFIQFQLTINIAALVINVIASFSIASFSTGDLPLNTVQLLWVNLIMDTLGALVLATESPTDHLPRSSCNNIMWRNLLIQAMYQVSVLLILNFEGRNILSLRHEINTYAVKVKNTIIFNAFVLCRVFNEFNIFKGVTKNYLFMGIVGLAIVIQIVIIEFLGNFTKTVAHMCCYRIYQLASCRDWKTDTSTCNSYE
ncbi:hypothetical protein KIW84_040531 [Lathyrus oleraceus]|uniref:Calcium-transporting ATPase n=1 Tax=Pisum sativum TaxID=3888 RepID=A0A9D4X7I2_PEA|nr:hypothetical protein KIW84_040531 [Pisum sativum]